MIIPSIECDMYRWDADRELLLSKTLPLLNSGYLLDLCFDKWLFYLNLVADIPYYTIPTTIEANFNAFPLPFILKPRHGYGSKGIIRVKNESDFESHRQDIGPNLMVQPIIGTEDEEYTVSGFFDNGSNLIDYFPLKRKLSVTGFTEQAEVEDRNFGEVLINLAKTFKPVGPTNFQFRMDGDMPKLLEINPRISSATSIRAAFGYNESQMSVDYVLSGKIPQKTDKTAIMGRKAIRYTEDYIF
jgi:carbamoyl-phosphate synthase large subunit